MATTETFEAELVEALREFAEAMDGHTPAEIAAVVGKMLADAVMAERKRCKDIADLYVSQARPAGDENVGDCPLTAHFDGQRLVAQNIGHDIENGL